MLLAFDLDDAHPAGAEAGQLGLVAEGRDLDAVVAADLEDGLALEALDDAPVDLDADRGVDCGRCGDWVSSSRSASKSALVRRSSAGSGRPRDGRGCRSSGSLGRGRLGWAGGGERRTRSIASRWSAGGWPAARGRTARRRRCRRRDRRQARRRSAGPGRPRGGQRARPGAGCRSGRGWSCRTPRSSRSGSARRPARRGRSGRRRRRPSRSRDGRPPRAGRRR